MKEAFTVIFFVLLMLLGLVGFIARVIELRREKSALANKKNERAS